MASLPLGILAGIDAAIVKLDAERENGTTTEGTPDEADAPRSAP